MFVDEDYWQCCVVCIQFGLYVEVVFFWYLYVEYEVGGQVYVEVCEKVGGVCEFFGCDVD